ncbi:[protein-PII] uridylyltransferase [Candidatus Magnetominusculus xianensis]|uniref:Bifunctional uridylyltransferase/uridylyl-removing enzyme n=1 Tax=Candidatus Magnetominusculus xianensis TaxID=1748249 RepID=A0ABR5SL47_9BACT|nr:[protein-PII] uridylyltransferase [Candidatus Magnetominusculus xianensis]KWT95161.1 uridylyltransferase [Candidatus Magnetominusculus xianensis]MBF0402808.1 [protein-PII] uridylyltransferase [Nitrospirota bacterium]
MKMNSSDICMLDAMAGLLADGFTGRDIVRWHAMKIDAVVRSALPQTHSMALFAIGGYGRCELAPFSDIDLMFVINDRSDTNSVEAVYYKLLERSLPLSHSVRTIDECIDELKRDVITRSSLLDARFLCGSPAIAKKYREIVEPEVFIKGHRDFFIARLKENQKRTMKFGKSVYMLQPNVKESDGGLRDVHEALWLSKIALHLKCIEDMSKILPLEDYKKLLKSYDFLLRLRTALHIVSARANDILSFDLQEDAARTLGLGASKYFRASERLLRFYYLKAKAIREITARVRNIAGSAYVRIRRKFTVSKINDTFSLSQNKIMINSTDALKKEPSLILDAYRMCSITGKDFTTFLRDFIKRHLYIIGKKTRSSPRAVTAFIDILKGSRVFTVLRAMHDDGVLDRFIPEFGFLRSLVVYEFYHVYTVDEHTLFTIKALETLAEDSNTLLGRTYHNFQQKHVLYLSLLFHDLGKSRGALHSAEGYKVIKPIMERFNLSKSEREEVEFLVRYHLLMSRTAFNSDIEDTEVIAAFSDSIKNERLLSALFLITYADMSAVNPDFFTSWKKNMLADLYRRMLKFMRGVKEDTYRYIDAFLEEGKHFPPATKQAITEFIGSLPERYLASGTPETVIKEFSLYLDFKKSGCAFSMEKNKDDTLSITIIGSDRPGLLSSIVGVLSARMFNIVSLRTFNSYDTGFIIDRIEIANVSSLWWDGLDDLLRDELTAAALGTKTPAIRQYPNKSAIFKPMLELDNESMAQYTIFEIMASDRVGLLYDMTRIFASNSLNILMARVNTESDLAHDVFYVLSGQHKPQCDEIMKVMAGLWQTLN